MYGQAKSARAPCRRRSRRPPRGSGPARSGSGPGRTRPRTAAGRASTARAGRPRRAAGRAWPAATCPGSSKSRLVTGGRPCLERGRWPRGRPGRAPRGSGPGRRSRAAVGRGSIRSARSSQSTAHSSAARWSASEPRVRGQVDVLARASSRISSTICSRSRSCSAAASQRGPGGRRACRPSGRRRRRRGPLRQRDPAARCSTGPLVVFSRSWHSLNSDWKARYLSRAETPCRLSDEERR